MNTAQKTFWGFLFVMSAQAAPLWPYLNTMPGLALDSQNKATVDPSLWNSESRDFGMQKLQSYTYQGNEKLPDQVTEVKIIESKTNPTIVQVSGKDPSAKGSYRIRVVSEETSHGPVLSECQVAAESGSKEGTTNCVSVSKAYCERLLVASGTKTWEDFQNTLDTCSNIASEKPVKTVDRASIDQMKRIRQLFPKLQVPLAELGTTGTPLKNILSNPAARQLASACKSMLVDSKSAILPPAQKAESGHK